MTYDSRAYIGRLAYGDRQRIRRGVGSGNRSRSSLNGRDALEERQPYTYKAVEDSEGNIATVKIGAGLGSSCTVGSGREPYL